MEAQLKSICSVALGGMYTIMEKQVRLKDGATLTAYLAPASSKPMRAVVICPGGGYGFVSPREGAPVAEELVNKGISAFVLDYSIAPVRYPTQIHQLASAVKHLRDNSAAYNVNPKKITVMGFSAGGHLAATLATQWQQDYLHDYMQCSAVDYCPNSVVLCYPVISAGAYGHRGTFDNLLGGDFGKLEAVSLEKSVTYNCPPVFVWHTVDDKVVPVENALLLITALRQKNVPFEAHIYPKGEHGLSLATPETAEDNPDMKNPHVASWFGLAVKWIKNQ